MPKNILNKILPAILIVMISGRTVFADFPDVDQQHKNSAAINYLQSNNIINGYPDGTFKPDNAVNRAEFLKIILEGSDIPALITSPTPFPDVNHDSWYGKYVIKAYHSGWIVGYTDGTFKPEQTINKVEALKILGKVQKWQLSQTVSETPFEDTPPDEWYLPYVTYAKNKGFLEESGIFFNPADLMTRASISEIIYRSLILPDTGVAQEIELIPADDEEESATSELGELGESSESFTPENFSWIETDFFENIVLDDSVPNIFYQNEVYVISGAVTSGDYDMATVITDGTSNSNYRSFSAGTENNRFDIPVYFDRPGNYNLGILRGDSGSARATPISVLPELPSFNNDAPPSAAAATGLDIRYTDDRTKISFTAQNSTFKKLTFRQDQNSFSYFSRQNIDTIIIQYGNFKNFTKNSVDYFIETASLASIGPLEINSSFTKSSAKKFIAEEHSFDEITAQITANPPDTLDSIQKISFSGTVYTDIFEEAYVIKPDGSVENITLISGSPNGSNLDSPTILNGGNFTYNYTPAVEGRHILEINDKEGKPILNHPVYIGNKIPLLPDFFDLNTRTPFEGFLDTSAARQEMLNFINEARAGHGLQNIVLDEELNTVAQGHSDDMAARNFFGHVNPDGKTPDDRRLEAGITTSVGENVVKDVTVPFAHYGLMRSASHRENILTPEWTRMGLGVSTKDGYIIIAQEFSTDKLTPQNIVDFKNEAYQGINTKRQNSGISALAVKSAAESTAKYLNDKAINENQAITGDTFSTATDANNLTGSSSASSITGTGWQSILDSILNKENAILDTTWLSFGIDIQLDSEGNIHFILVLNSQS
ncbi:S-layer homology domain-containing protein [Candidatus Peregrinibacteria bacterium]|nr:S-layer homology domain-containing protein [Candidatus Peregrinibacteria bacterium]